MKGLLIKDLRLMLMNKMTMLFIVGLAVFFAIIGADEMASTYIMMLSPVCAMLAAGTVTYDDYDNGFGFLMTLPVTRKNYVIEKYIFIILAAVVGAILSVVVILVSGEKKEGFMYSIIMLFVMAVLYQMLYIPIIIKLGIEKAKIYSMILIGVFAGGLGYIAGGFIEDIVKYPVVAKLLTLDKGVVIALIGVVFFASVVISIKVSTYFMNKKEF